MFGRFDENPAMTLRVIKETKRYGRTDGRTDGRTHGQRENSIPPTNKVCGGHKLQTKFAGGIKRNLMSTCPGLNLVQSIFSCLSALINPHVNLSWAKFSSSLVDIKICLNQ